MKSAYLRAGVVIAVLAAAAAYLLWPADFPTPVESRRVRSSHGYSMVAPPGWVGNEAIVTQGGLRDMLTFVPIEQGKLSYGVSVRRYAIPPTPESLEKRGFANVVFQNQPAVMRGSTARAISTCQLIFQRGGETFEINASLTDLIVGPSDAWWKYWETFKYQPPATTAP